MSYLGMVTEIVPFTAHNGDKGQANYARPTTKEMVGGVVLIHHMPGWDDWIQEAARKLAHYGFACIAPDLYFREGPGSPDDCAARSRAKGGVTDEQVMGDVAGAMAFLRAQANSNGKVAVMGFCSGGRQTYLAACSLNHVDAAVDCWGGRVIVEDPADITPARPVAPIELTSGLNCPLLGIFGNDDANPSPKQVNDTEAVLKKLGKTYEFHRYDGVGHGFFAVDRPAYKPEQAKAAWQKVIDFLDKTIGPRARFS
ncbi:dienelactone hydrolase family protein [Roseiarcaceae bacterium H3SJ34-1]|uniref:dienelactone hydrolase family protein n=1 Tax=Terripilifer ovatus TaxID=3032367 RepID=UPI003AB9992C|nr:dienelactone hydrolase family protein [Roseiarcaceae bacterium H3SJ34-1]